MKDDRRLQPEEEITDAILGCTICSEWVPISEVMVHHSTTVIPPEHKDSWYCMSCHRYCRHRWKSKA